MNPPIEPGLLAAANRGILYVDEVNLLEDHLVDLLLDAATTGINIVEREGVQYAHPSRFMLIGTMNPEEGELRPQFLDRFGLCIQIETLKEADQRKEIIHRRIAFEKNPDQFTRQYAEAEKLIASQVAVARANFREVEVSDAILEAAVDIAITSEVQGHRAEITLIRAATVLAALLDKTETGPDELSEVARLVLPHRLASNPLERPQEIDERIEDILAKSLGITADRETTIPDDAAYMMDNHGFPGSAAAGSTLFTYLKKKMPTAPSSRTTRSS
jgi:Mg-chelatase subunit ChlI